MGSHSQINAIIQDIMICETSAPSDISKIYPPIFHNRDWRHFTGIVQGTKKYNHHNNNNNTTATLWRDVSPCRKSITSQYCLNLVFWSWQEDDMNEGLGGGALQTTIDGARLLEWCLTLVLVFLVSVLYFYPYLFGGFKI